MRRNARDDSEVLLETYGSYIERLVRAKARRWPKDAREDFVAEARIKCLGALEVRDADVDSECTYEALIAKQVHALYDALRKKAVRDRQRNIPAGEWIEQIPDEADPVDEVVIQAVREALPGILARLPQAKLEFLYDIINGMSHREAAFRYHIAYGTSRNRYSQYLRELRNTLTPDEAELLMSVL